VGRGEGEGGGPAVSDEDRAAALKFRPPVGTYSEHTLVGVWRTQSKNGSVEHISRITKVQCPVCKGMLREWADLPPPRCAKCDPLGGWINKMHQWARDEEANRAKLPAANSPPPPIAPIAPIPEMPSWAVASGSYHEYVARTARWSPENNEKSTDRDKECRATAQAALEACTSKTAPIRIGTVVKDYGDKWIEIEVDFATKNDGYIQHRQAFMNDTGDLRKAYELAAFTTLQREAGGKSLEPDQKARASAEWSAQLRLKVEAAKERDREASRYTPYWSPEEQSGGDL
jgi:hypothetical protein